jgi:hypothetical protein
MERRLGFVDDTRSDVSNGWDPNDLLHPAQAYEHPSHVVNDPDLTLTKNARFLLRGRLTRRAGGGPAFALRSCSTI